MASGNVTLYSANKNNINLAALSGATLKIALVTSSYTPNTANGGDSTFANVSANEIAAGNGYTAGGATLTSVTVTATAGNNGFKISSANPSWTASGGSIPAWRYAVIYVSGSLWGLTNPVVGYFLGDTTPADIPATTAGNPLTINCPATGWFDIT